MDEVTRMEGVPQAGAAEPSERSERGAAESACGTGVASGEGSRRHSEEVRAQVLSAYLQGRASARELAARFELAVSTIYGWAHEARRAKDQPVVSRGLQRRMRRRRRRAKRAAAAKARVYTPEERRAALEAYGASGLSQEAFARTWGLSVGTLQHWLKRYAQGGPKGLEPKVPGRKPGEGPVALAPAVREAVVETKRSYPSFGLRKVQHFLRRFRGLRVCVASIGKTLKAAQREGVLELRQAPQRKPRVKRVAVRRFERSRPGELWQSDLTSFVLARCRQPVYLVVFLDDYSRFVVSWALAYQAKSELVLEALRSAIVRFGAPQEVLTDQGRQYYAWRGKSAFQKLLGREGIAHVVARAHHPQTVGKCERLWETVECEFWARRMPQDLEEARERFVHFVAHYNFHRPHQALGGLVPADRFFGAERVAQAAIEAGVQRNELRLALGERPRKPLFLYGQLGDQQVALHGERGRLVIHTPEGVRQEMDFEELGMRGAGNQEQGDEQRACDEDRNGGKPDESAGSDCRDGAEENEATAGAAGPQADELQKPPADGLPGAGAVGGGERGGSAAGAAAVRVDPGAVAGQADQGAGGRASATAATSNLAVVTAGALGDAGCPGPSAAHASAPGGGDAQREPGRTQGAAQGERRAEEAPQSVRGAERDPALPAATAEHTRRAEAQAFALEGPPGRDGTSRQTKALEDGSTQLFAAGSSSTSLSAQGCATASWGSSPKDVA
jgi:transposase InsO family protein